MIFTLKRKCSGKDNTDYTPSMDKPEKTKNKTQLIP
jgi:hypothetical protein